MTRARSKKPSAPRSFSFEVGTANDNADLIANDAADVKEGPSARLLRQMLRRAHAEAAKGPEPEAHFEWTESQLTRLRRAEAKKASPDKRAQANGVAEMARLMRERDGTLERITREAHEAETVGLAALRGEEIDISPRKPGEPAKPMLRRSGLDWLWKKRRISEHQQIAGLRYGDEYRVAEDFSLRSCLAGAPTGGDAFSRQDLKREMTQRLAAARAHGLGGHEGMIALCDRVCGDGRTIRQMSGDSDAEAAKNEAILCIALDLLAAHYGVRNRCVQPTST